MVEVPHLFRCAAQRFPMREASQIKVIASDGEKVTTNDMEARVSRG
jgi:hypothetical protein